MLGKGVFMKKVLPVILVLVLLLTAAVALVACSDQEPTIVRYYVNYPLDSDKNMKDSYSFKSGETFQNSSIQIVCVMSDKTEKILPTNNADVTKIVYSDEMKALLDKDNKFIDVTEVKVVTLTVTFLDVEPFEVKITVRPKG